MAELSTNEHIEYISGSLRLIVSKSHTFGTDALLLAAFSAPKKQDKVCDFGTGCGIIPFYWLREGVQQVSAVELQQNACEQLRRSIDLNGLSERFTLINGDIKELNGELPAAYFDLITMNPPYTAEGQGIKSSAHSDRIARHETRLTLPELFSAAARHLKFGGRLCICLRPERLTDAMAGMRAAGIEPKRLRFAALRSGRAPWLFLLEGKRGRAPGLIVENELYITDAEGNKSAEMQKIYGEYFLQK